MDEKMPLMISMTKNPSLNIKTNVDLLDHTYRRHMRDGNIKYIDNKLCLFEPISHTTRQLKLIIVPDTLKNHIVVAMHVNPLGGHYSLYHTVHRIRLRFFWHEMYKYIKHFISICAGCILKIIHQDQHLN